MNKDTHKSPVLVIGSGAGGLSTAIILALLGYRVTVLESGPVPGGLMTSYRRMGVDCPIGVHYLGSLGEGQVLKRMFDYLGVGSMIPVERMGREGIIDKYIFNDFTFNMPEGVDEFCRALLESFPGDKQQISRLSEKLVSSAGRLNRLDLLFPGENNSALIGETRSMGRVLDEMECSPELKKVFGVTAAWIGVDIDECPRFLHNTTLVSYLLSSWRLACGSHEMAAAFVSRLRELGGEIKLKERVKRIFVEEKTVTGVELDSGEIIGSSLVVGAIHPRSVIGMLPEKGAVRPSYRNRINRLKDTDGVFSLHALISGSSQEEIPHNTYLVESDSSGSIKNMIFIQLRKSGIPGKSLLTIMDKSHIDQWSEWMETSSGRRGARYEDKKDARAKKLLKTAESVIGSVGKCEIIDTYTPLTIRDWTGSPEGSAYGIRKSTGQLIGSSMMNRTSVKGLFMAGQSVLAPGIIGTILGSFSTVRAIIGREEFLRNIKI